MMITHDDLDGVEEKLARLVLVRARSIAPCLDSLEDEDRDNAIAVLTLIAEESPAPGMRRARAMSRNGTSISLSGDTALFGVDDVAALRALCPGAEALGMPRGSFPLARPLARIWPEDC